MRRDYADLGKRPGFDEQRRWLAAEHVARTCVRARERRRPEVRISLTECQGSCNAAQLRKRLSVFPRERQQLREVQVLSRVHDLGELVAAQILRLKRNA